MKVRLREYPQEAHRWYQNGDHPRDEYVPGSGAEGKFVRRFRHPNIPGNTLCDVCLCPMHDHGWIEPLGTEGGGDVCPGDWIITSWPEDNAPQVVSEKLFKQLYEVIVK